ncbi:hypothetical protein GW7_12075 [Heterocephalus glaber]|uniref:Uncharacterized protein n=1 Tax=Heterocephalus glaber TaxID=10181 RepID=G5B0D5_HETGA|nr:hypothetical protein GW7_12075 [Heterocephalus glaber]
MSDIIRKICGADLNRVKNPEQESVCDSWAQGVGSVWASEEQLIRSLLIDVLKDLDVEEMEDSEPRISK